MKSITKLIKNNLLGFIVGAVVFGSVGVFALTVASSSVSYDNSKSKLNATNLQDAIDELYSKKPTCMFEDNKICTLKSGTHMEIGALYDCEVGPSIHEDFYILAKENNVVRMLMEHNLTSDTVGITWMQARDIFNDSSIQNGVGTTAKETWTNVIDIDLPMAQDIANAVGNTGWNMEDKNFNEWFYLDKNGNAYGQVQVANANNLSNYRWLYNYTRECKDCGCDAATSLGAGEAYGYWTRDIVALNSDTTYPYRAWGVYRYGCLSTNPVSYDTSRGVRPVITILKSGLSG